MRWGKLTSQPGRSCVGSGSACVSYCKESNHYPWLPCSSIDPLNAVEWLQEPDRTCSMASSWHQTSKLMAVTDCQCVAGTPTNELCFFPDLIVAAEGLGGPHGAARRAAARPPHRYPTHIRAPATLTARGAPVQIWQPWEVSILTTHLLHTLQRSLGSL